MSKELITINDLPAFHIPRQGGKVSMNKLLELTISIANAKHKKALSSYKAELKKKIGDINNFRKSIDYIEENWIKGENKERGKATVLLGLVCVDLLSLIDGEE